MKRTISAAVLIGVLVACGDTSSKGDSDRPTSIDDSGPVVINFPDLYMNVAFKCMGVNGIYTHTRNAAPVVIANDPECQESDK